jgi:hypothetical protein
MGKSSTNQKEILDLLISEKPNELKKIINHIRQIVLDVDPFISEQVKWNSPSFHYTGELKSNIAKAYPRDILVLNLNRGYVLMIFPSGAKIQNHDDFLEGDYKDGRRMHTIKDYDSLIEKQAKLVSAIKQWIMQIDE